MSSSSWSSPPTRASHKDWTTDRRLISRAVREASAAGGTAIYDAVATAIPTAQAGTHRKKALLVISDGNDTNSSTSVGVLRQQIRESDVLVYALGIDGSGRRSGDGLSDRPSRFRSRCPSRFPAAGGPIQAGRRSEAAAAAGQLPERPG